VPVCAKSEGLTFLKTAGVGRKGDINTKSPISPHESVLGECWSVLQVNHSFLVGERWFILVRLLKLWYLDLTQSSRLVPTHHTLLKHNLSSCMDSYVQ